MESRIAMNTVQATLQYLFRKSNIEEKYNQIFNCNKSAQVNNSENLPEIPIWKLTNSNNINKQENVTKDNESDSNTTETSTDDNLTTKNNKKRKSELDCLVEDLLENCDLDESIQFRERKCKYVNLGRSESDNSFEEEIKNNEQETTLTKSEKKTSNEINEMETKSIIEEINSDLRSEEEEPTRVNEMEMNSQQNHTFRSEQIRFLKNIIIKRLGTPPPALHTIISGLNRTLLDKDKERIKNLNLEIKSGPFNKAEDEIVQRNWKRFCKLHNLDPHKPSLFFNLKIDNGFKHSIMRKNQFIKFVQHLAYELDKRTLRSVYVRFVIIYSNIKTGRYDESEDKMISKYIRAHGIKKCEELAKLMNRSPRAIYDRYLKLKMIKNEDRSYTPWTIPKMERFINNLLKVTKIDNINNLHNENITDIHWKELSTLENNIDKKRLKRTWIYFIQPRLTIESSVDWIEMKIKLINLLYERNENVWNNIKWDIIAKEFNGVTPKILQTKFFRLVQYHVPNYKNMDLNKCLKCLMEIAVPKYKLQHKKTPKFVYENGKLKFAPNFCKQL